MQLPDEQQLLDDIAHAHGQAKSLKSLYSLYGLKGPARVALRRHVRRLVAHGKLVQLRGERVGIPRKRQTVTGVLAGTQRGFGFVSPDDPKLPDILVPEQFLRGAIHGDRVEVAYLSDSVPERPKGEVHRIVERGDERIVGLFVAGDRRRGEHNRLRPFDPRITAEIHIPRRFALDAEDGTYVDAVLLHDATDPKDGKALVARVVAILGRPEEPGTDVRVIMRAYRLQDAHAPAAVAEAERQASRGIPPEELARRRDMRSLPTVTIDGETARDFDDAVSVERRGPLVRLHVHISDVSFHVAEGTALDADAYERATSVYFPDRAIHMLPEGLSAGACSLRPDEDRLAVTVTMDVDRAGEIVHAEFCESVIRSRKRMTYTAIKRILVDRDEDLRKEHEALLGDFELMAEVARALIGAREARGGLDFDLPVPMVKVDADGIPVDIVESERNVAHRIIEEFMIAANRCVAQHLDASGEPSMYRNHEPPPADKVAAFRAAAATFGHVMPEGDEVTPLHFDKVLRAVRGRPEEPLLTMLALRSMSLARYAVEDIGHFGLALSHYTHFTSPIRRYPDLVVHRALKRLMTGERTPPEDGEEATAELAADAAHCSRAERNAEAAERALVEWKVAVFMERKVGEVMDANVSGVSERGLFVVLRGHRVDAYLPFESMPDDHYEREASGLRCVGRRTGRTLRLGDALRVRVASVDLFRRRVHVETA